MKELFLLTPEDSGALEVFRGRLTVLVDSWGLEQRTVFKVELIVEELYTNYLKYAVMDNTEPVEILLELQEEKLHITFKDNGSPFNPVKVPTPDVNLPLEERQAGGLGLHLVKHFTDDRSYTREQGWNILKMTITKQRK